MGDKQKKEVEEVDVHRTLSAQDVRLMLGENNAAKIAEILVLQPTLMELEEAIMWSRGDGYLLGRRPLTGNAAKIFEIIKADREEDEDRTLSSTATNS
jgi:hypothetical protein